MKALIRSTLFLFLLATAVSCKKYLAVEPKNYVSDEFTIYDKTSAEQAVRGIYNALGNAGYYGTSFQSIGYLSGDNIQWTGSQSQVQEFINHDVKIDNPTISAAWTAIYRTINRANNVIAKIPSVNDNFFTPAYRKQLTAEAYFVRALSYFDLARTWGGVPLITQPTLTSTDNTGIGRATLEQTYTQVINDLDSAQLSLTNSTNRYRATLKTVWALKARYYLYRQAWDSAATYASKIIDDVANYKLIAPYNNFIVTKGTPESVFEIYYNGTTEPNSHGGQWLPQTLGGTRQWAPNDAFVALANNSGVGGNRDVLVSRDNQNRWYGNLYRSVTSASTYVIRTAEIYLVRAEARAQKNLLTEALADLNAVRVRAGAEVSNKDTQEGILLDIENERRIEFAFEPHRWFDLVRTDRAKTVLGFTDSNKYLLPIPYSEVLKNNALAQNPGYPQ